MSDTKIEWATKVWNPVTGCTLISEGCANCYAARMAKRLAGRYGYPKDEPFSVTSHPNKLDEPYRWRKPQRIFVCSMGDLFHEAVRQKTIANVFDIAYRSYIQYGHTFMFLTKRPQRMNDEIILWSHVRGIDIQKLDGFWLGVTAENQRTADERIPILLQIPAAKRFVSVEPMLGPIQLNTFWLECTGAFNCDKQRGVHGKSVCCPPCPPRLDWVIAGPETGPKARPFERHWLADLCLQTRDARVPFFDKRDVLGKTIQEFPR